MNKTILKNTKGFTLIEIIVSIAIIGIIGSSVLSVFFNSMNISQNAKKQMLATFLAQNEMEKIKGDDITWPEESQIEEDEENNIKKIKYIKNQNGFEIISSISLEENFISNGPFAIKIEIRNKKLALYKYDIEGNLIRKLNLNADMQSLRIQKEISNIKEHHKISLYSDSDIIPFASFEWIGEACNIKIEIYAIDTINEIIGINLNRDVPLLQNNIFTLYIFKNDLSSNPITLPQVKTSGNVAIYNDINNIYMNLGQNRLYKVEVIVKKENKILEKIQGYKRL